MPVTRLNVNQVSEDKRLYLMVPNTTTSVLAVGNAAWTTAGTLATPAIASTNLLASVRRTTFSSGTVAGTVASFRNAQTELWRGNAAGLGGFLVKIRFGLDTLQTGMRAFLGIVDVTTASGNVDPTTNTTPGKVGLAINASTGNWQLVYNLTGAAPTVLDLGANFPVNTTHLLELTLACSPNDAAISYQVKNLSTGNVANGSLSTNIPAAATFMAVQGWITNNAQAAAAIMAVNKVYVETSY